MGSWKSSLNSDPTGWLLESSDASIRYYTLTGLLERSEDDPEVKEARAAIMHEGPVAKILEHQEPQGCWSAPKRFYTHKYHGTLWQLIVLAELGADGTNPQIRKACEFILEHSQDPASGGFSMKTGAKKGGGLHSEVIPCLVGNAVWSLIRFGYLDDPRVQRGLEWISRYQRFDDGIPNPPTGWPYEQFEMCWGGHTCHMGVVKNLKALSAVPQEKRTEAMRSVIEKGAEFLLIHHIYKRSRNPDKVAKPGWLHFGFPLMYQTDILEILFILTELGFHDERMKEAVDVVLSKQDENGKWIMENSFNDRMPVPVETKGKVSYWITLRALRIIKKYFA